MRSRLHLSLAPIALAGLLRADLARAAGPPPPPPPATATIDEQAELEKARNAYRAKQYDEADARFIRMLDPKAGILHDKVLIRQARMYWAATLIAEHHDEEATLLFESILTDDRDYEPDPLAFPTEVVNAFIDTRARLREKLQAIERDQYRRAAERRKNEEEAKRAEIARVKLLEEYAGRAEVTQVGRRVIALVPFGAGQFQNHDSKLGWVFLGSESALLAAALITVPVYITALRNAATAYSSNVFSAPSENLAQQYLDRANTARYVNLALNGALAATAIAGVIQAEAAFVPQVTEYRKRTIPVPPPPQSPPLSFGVAPLGGREGRVAGGLLSVGGSF